MGEHKGKKNRERLVETHDEKPMTTAQAAEILNVHQQTIVNYCDRGELAFHRFGPKGKHRRIYKKDLMRLVNERVEYFEPKKTVQVPASVIPMIDNQLRVWNQQSTAARADGKNELADKIDGWCEGMNVSRRIVERCIIEPELSQYREKGVDYFI